jgi:hypothetical protein
LVRTAGFPVRVIALEDLIVSKLSKIADWLMRKGNP